MEINLTLSTKGIKSAIRELKSVKSTLEERIEAKNQQLVAEGKRILDEKIGSINNYDNNAIGNTYGTAVGNNGTIEWHGEQIAFLEFGTGTVGKQDSYPGIFPVPWEYANSTYSKRHEDGHWSYKNSSGDLVRTYGIPAYAPMLKTSEELKKKIPEIYKGLLGGEK